MIKNRKQHLKGLLALAQSENLYTGRFAAFVQEALRYLSHCQSGLRAGFWIYDSAKESLVNMHQFAKGCDGLSSGEVLQKDHYPRYFEAFESSLFIDVTNAAEDPRTSEFADCYLKTNEVASMFDVQVCVHGQLFGILCIEATGKVRKWDPDLKLQAISIASYIGQAQQAKLRIQAEEKHALTEINYQRLFNDSPIPMWVCAPDTLEILAVNSHAIADYGYTRERFLTMNLADLAAAEYRTAMGMCIRQTKGEPAYLGEWQHTDINGLETSVALFASYTKHNDRPARIVIAIDKSDEVHYRREAEQYIRQLTDFAFYASHDLRGPVARLLGLVNMLQAGSSKEDTEKIVEYIGTSASEIDSVVWRLHNHLQSKPQAGESSAGLVDVELCSE